MKLISNSQTSSNDKIDYIRPLDTRHRIYDYTETLHFDLSNSADALRLKDLLEGHQGLLSRCRLFELVDILLIQENVDAIEEREIEESISR